MRYLVTARFKARDGRRLVPGDVLETDDARRIADLRSRRLIGRRLPSPPEPPGEGTADEPVPEVAARASPAPAAAEKDAFDELAPGPMAGILREMAESAGVTLVKGEEPPVAPKHVGGGWWLLPDGRKVQGREAAEEALAGETE